MSELSTVAIKDGHRGHLPHHSHQPMNEERADRISRLAGLERVGGGFGAQPARTLTPGGAFPGQGAALPTQGYFDANNNPQIFRERSTVGSASATGSVGGRTTWASGSDVYDADKMSEDTYPDTQAGDVDTSSMGGFSDEATSLVGFGEGARTPARQTSVLGSPAAAKATPSALPAYLREQGQHFSIQSTPSAERQDARMIDGMTYDPDVVDTTSRPPAPTAESGAETAERILRERRGREGSEDGDM